MSAPEIGGIPVTAPIWRGAAPEALEGIVQKLSSASHHFADDSGGEWGAAFRLVAEAAQEINRLGLCTRAIEVLLKHRPQLMDFGAVMDAVLRDARAAA